MGSNRSHMLQMLSELLDKVQSAGDADEVAPDSHILEFVRGCSGNCWNLLWGDKDINCGRLFL